MTTHNKKLRRRRQPIQAQLSRRQGWNRRARRRGSYALGPVAIRRGSQDKRGWNTEHMAGFEVSVASNSVTEEIRTIYLLAEPRAFTEENLKLIFAHLAEEFAEPNVCRAER